MKNEFSKRGYNVSSSGAIFLVLSIFGLDIIANAIMQNDFNSLPATTYSNQRSTKTNIKYSLRLIPIGGYVSMAGEDEESDDPNAFHQKPVWQRFIITAAGAATNIIAGILVMSVLIVTAPTLASTTIYSFSENNVSAQYGLRENDRVTKVGAVPVFTGNELVYEIMRQGIRAVDVTVERDGERIVLEDVKFGQMTESGVEFGSPDFVVYAEAKTLLSLAKHSVFRSLSTIKMIWDSLIDLISGRYGMEAISGPIGVAETMVQAAEESVSDLVYLAVVISMNLGVMNLLPFPALDGGRLVFLVIEGIRRKPLSPKVEGYVHFAGFVLLMILMVVIMVKDVVGLFA